MIKETAIPELDAILEQSRIFFKTGATKESTFRIKQLKLLKQLIVSNESALNDALFQDLKKSNQEVFLTEFGPVIQEIDLHIKYLKEWSRKKRVPTPLFLFPNESYIQPEPLGVVLIVAPWNYPFQLVFIPLIGAIAAGNCAVVKPSPATPSVARLIETMIKQIFDERFITVVQGDIATNQHLFHQSFDLIFFTGSSRLGKIVMEAAAKKLTPVVLELGGKSPCIVDASAKIDQAAKRIAWGKTINAGQTCTAPDFLMIHSSLKQQFIERFNFYIHQFFGENPAESPFYPKIIHQDAMKRLVAYLVDGEVIAGGNYNIESHYFQPTLLSLSTTDVPIMQAEIFGPILPMITFEELDEAINFLQDKPKPLALYFFGKQQQATKVTTVLSSGNVCINHTLIQVANHHLPFGGIGNSGMGAYHGYKSFETFSHFKSLVKSPNLFDVSSKYAPFKFLNWVKKLM